MSRSRATKTAVFRALLGYIVRLLCTSADEHRTIGTSAPAALARALSRSVGGVPDEREGVFVAARSTAKIGVEPTRSELRSRKGQAHIIASSRLGTAVPAGANFDAAGEHAIVRLVLVSFVLVGDDLDVGG